VSFAFAQEARQLCYWIHVGGCFASLPIAAMALYARKTSSWHRFWGRGYVALASVGTIAGVPPALIILIYAEEFGNITAFKKVDVFFGFATTALLLANLWNACEAVRLKRRLSLRIASPTFALNSLAVLVCGLVSAGIAGNPALFSTSVYPVEFAARHLLLLALSALLLARARAVHSDQGWKFHHAVNVFTSLLFMLRALVAGAPARFFFGFPTPTTVIASFDLLGALIQTVILFYYFSSIRSEEVTPSQARQ
jgi:hypothetical protein